MKRWSVAFVALACGFAIAAPTVVMSADPPTTEAPQTAPFMGRGHPAGTRMGGPAFHGEASEAMGPMGRGAMMGRMGHTAQLSPQQHCINRLALRASRIAYTITVLNLNPQQRQLWDKVDAVVRDRTEKGQQLCATLAQPGQASMLDRVGRREQFLAAELQGLQQVKPPLEQFYQSLTAEQKELIDHPRQHGRSRG